MVKIDALNDITLCLIVAIPFISSLIIGFFRSSANNNEAFFAGAITVTILALTIILYPAVADGSVARVSFPWLADWGLNFTLRIDGFSWLFSLLISGIGLLVIIYARYYMDPADPVPRFLSFLLAFMGAMLGLVLAGNIILLAVFWELTSIFSFLLIGYWYHNASAREGARMALIVTGFGGFALLISMLIIGHIVGSYELDHVLQSGSKITSSPLFLPALLGLLIAALTKSVQFPFHFWLPSAMAAPTPVSAYLHSATMVKAGVFLLARFWPVFAETPQWFWLLGLAGLITLFWGAFLAIFQQDLKGLLAYSTISHLGLITTLLSLGSPLACVAAIFHMANHAIFKASLFMAAGIIDHETGTRDLRKLSGLFRSMPYTGTLALVASAAMAGVPLLNGFLSKEMFFAETAATHLVSWLDKITPYIAVIAGLFSVTYSLRFIHGTFFGPPATKLEKKPHEPPRFMRLPIEVLVVLCLVIGIVPNWSIGAILANAVHAVLGRAAPSYSLAIWHGFTAPLFMSAVALLGGSILYIGARQYLATYHARPPILRALTGQRLFERLLLVVSWRWARGAEKLLSTNRLQPQIRWLLLIGMAFVVSILWLQPLNIGRAVTSLNSVSYPFAIMWLIGSTSAIAAAITAKFHRLASIIFLSTTGLMTCGTFLWLSAPDLAVTQLLVEVITSVLLLLGLRWLTPRLAEMAQTSTPFAAWLRRSRDGVIAVLAGSGLGFLAYQTMSTPAFITTGDYYLQNSYKETGGRNVVNVLLVDYRGFDTLGEISVLIIVALAVFALLRRFRPAADSVNLPNAQHNPNRTQCSLNKGQSVTDYLIVPAFLIHWLLPIIVSFSIFLMLRGHDLPGGGFAAGVSLAIGVVLQYVAAGTKWVEVRLTILPLRWMGVGLLLAIATGISSWFFSYQFLTTFFGYITIPIIGKVPVASALIFDIGVFSVVVGAIILMLIAIAHQSIRYHRAQRDRRLKENV